MDKCVTKPKKLICGQRNLHEARTDGAEQHTKDLRYELVRNVHTQHLFVVRSAALHPTQIIAQHVAHGGRGLDALWGIGQVRHF